MLTQPIQELLRELEKRREAQELEERVEMPLETNALVSSAAAFYEKVRYLIDYREEHTIRRSAIERILKRRVILEGRAIDGVDLLRELAEGQYVSADQVTEARAEGVTRILSRFTALSRSGDSGIVGRLLSLAATEIEHLFAEDEALADALAAEGLYKTMRDHVTVAGRSKEAVDTQLFLAAHRALLGLDNDGLFYALWKRAVPGWGERDDVRPEKPLGSVFASIETALRDPLQWQLVPKLKNETIYFHVIREVVRTKPGSAEWMLETPDQLDTFTRDFLDEKYAHENVRLQRSGKRAVIYLFCTKIVAAFFLELPYELFVLGKIHYMPLLTNIVFHPLLLLVATRSAGRLGDANTERVITGLHDLLYKGKVRAIRIGRPNTLVASLFGTAYLILVFLIFAGIVGVLSTIGFNFVSIVLFMVFLALVSYFAYRVRSGARRWKVSGKDGALAVVGHVLAIPIVRAGRWLSRTFSSVNVFVLFMDFIIETPFKLILDFSSKFMSYLREKAEDVY